jgi:hypothetical protein
MFMRLDGSTKTEDRSEMLKHFNAKDSPYFVSCLVRELVVLVKSSKQPTL